MMYEGIETKREPTKVEIAVLELAKAIDRFELALLEQERTIDRMIGILEVIEKRDQWIEHYREHAGEGLPAL